MKDKLEDFIVNNREAFDDLEPDPGLWKGVRTRDPEIKRINWINTGWKVAAAIAIFIASYFFFHFMNNNNNEELYSDNMKNSEEYQDLIDAEAFYSAQIKPIEQQVYFLTGTNQDLRADIQLEMKELDSIFIQLRNDLNENISNAEIIEAMIQNYRTKLTILEEILFQLQKANTTEDETTFEL